MSHFPARWNHGAPDCAQSADPPFQVHAYDEWTYILRQSKCVTFEAPFLYLLVGHQFALLLDTGGEPDAGGDTPIRQVVDEILARHPAVELIVGHTHSHADHAFGDRYFADRPNTRIIGLEVEEVARAYGIPEWPDGDGFIDLGGRPLTVVPAPGHEPASVCFYDPARHLLLTGDVLYPGKLTVRDAVAYRETAARLGAFAEANRVEFVLGCHVEMKHTPGELYEIGTTYQPDEHVLQLTGADLAEWAEACEYLDDGDDPIVRNRFVVWPVKDED